MTLTFWSYAINKLNFSEHVKQRLNILFCKQMKFSTFFVYTGFQSHFYICYIFIRDRIEFQISNLFLLGYKALTP